MPKRILKELGKMQGAVIKPLFYYSIIALFIILFISVLRTSIFPEGADALIIALFGLNSGALSIPEYSIISAMAFITTIVVPPIFGRSLSKGGAAA